MVVSRAPHLAGYIARHQNLAAFHHDRKVAMQKLAAAIFSKEH